MDVQEKVAYMIYIAKDNPQLTVAALAALVRTGRVCTVLTWI